MKKHVLILSFIATLSTTGNAETFQQCPTTVAPRTELDPFCPQLEGIHPEGCCPQIFKSPPLKCYYAIYESQGQSYLAQSSYTKCQGGTNVSVPCCVVRKRGCYRDLKQLDFLPRLIGRDDNCCFENCPPADYWRSPPANPAIGPKHELSSAGVNICTGTTIDQCDAGDSANCQTSDPCPTPPSPPSPPAPPAPPSPPSPPSPPAPNPPNPPNPPSPPNPPTPLPGNPGG